MPPKKTTKERRESSLSDNYNNQVTQHALVSTSKEIGIATGILPVVSTLTFGFATNVLLDSNSQAPATVLILVSLSACCSLYTTTYSVLEFYYVAMLTASDTKSTYLEGEASLHQGRQQLDDLARQVDIMTMAFEPWRAEARNCLWYSVILIIAAGIAQIIEKRKLLRIDTAVIILILFVGVAIVPITVKKFRSSYRPLLQAYRLTSTLKTRKESTDEYNTSI